MITLNETRYEHTTYDTKTLKTVAITAAERKQVDGDASDLFISAPDGVLSFQPELGERVEHRGNWPGMGSVMLAVLQAMMVNPGEFLTPAEIASITGISSLRYNNNLSARVAKLRQFFHDKSEWFIQTRASGGYAIRFSPHRTFSWLERISARGETGAA